MKQRVLARKPANASAQAQRAFGRIGNSLSGYSNGKT